jgi:hypothetical protein
VGDEFEELEWEGSEPGAGQEGVTLTSEWSKVEERARELDEEEGKGLGLRVEEEEARRLHAKGTLRMEHSRDWKTGQIRFLFTQR